LRSTRAIPKGIGGSGRVVRIDPVSLGDDQSMSSSSPTVASSLSRSA
jgi:hypothetical protein